jgi:hypothetical protein
MAGKSRARAAAAPHCFVAVIIALGRLTMDSFGQTPFFCVVRRDGDQGLVEAEWSDGTIVEVESFKAHLDALNWVKTQSQVSLQGRGDAISGELRAIADELHKNHA